MATDPPTRLSLFVRLQDPRDAEARQLFCDIYEPLIRKYVRYDTTNPTDADDVAQEVVYKVLKKLPDFKYDPQKGRFRAWLRTVTHNAFLDLCTERRERGTGDDAVQAALLHLPDRDKAWEYEYKLRLLEWAMAKVRHEFDDPTYESFHRFYITGELLREIAPALGTNVPAVVRAKARVLDRIRATLAEAGGDVEELP